MSSSSQKQEESRFKAKEDQFKLKDNVEIWQGVFNLLRDASIFLVFFLLLVHPEAINTILTRAGFEEGNLVGFKWKNQLQQNDKQLRDAENIINELTQKLKESTETIEKIKSQVLNKEELSQKLEEQIRKNREVADAAASIKPEIKSTLRTNAPLLDPLVRKVNEYQIKIFYNRKKSEQKIIAFEIKQALEDVGVTSLIKVLPQRDKASSDQIRYFPENESEVANALQSILTETYPKRSFRLQRVYTRTPGEVSIFLKTES